MKNARNLLYFAALGVVLRISMRFQETYDLSLPKQTFLPKEIVSVNVGLGEG